jgi:hypothetical protein
MGEPVEITPLEYLNGGLIATDKLRVQLSDLIKQYFAKAQHLRAKMTSIHSSIIVNQVKANRLLEVYKGNEEVLPLVAKYIANLVQLEQITACDNIERTYEAMNCLEQCRIKI